MKNSIREKLKEQRAAVSVLVFITVLTFVVVLLGSYLTVTTLKKSQLKSDIRLQDVYGKDVNRVDEIYEELVSVDKVKPTCEISYNVLEDTSISYQFAFSESIKNFTVEDIKIYNASSIDTQFEETMTLSTSSPAYATNLIQNKIYAISFDYKCLSGKQEFEFGLYSDTQTNLPTKKLTATEELKHEDYKIEFTNIEAQFKILAQIEESNNVTLSNFQIVEIQNTEVEKEGLIKKDNKTYSIRTPYEGTSKYVVIIEDGVCTDMYENDNEGTIKVI